MPVLISKLQQVDSLLEDMRCILCEPDQREKPLDRVEEVIAALKRLRWCLEGQVEFRKTEPQREAVLRFTR